MKVGFAFRNLGSSDAIKNYAADKLTKLDKYLSAPGDAEVIASLERHLQCVDITVVSGGQVYASSHGSDDMYASIDLATDKLDRQIRRAKATRRKRRRSSATMKMSTA